MCNFDSDLHQKYSGIVFFKKTISARPCNRCSNIGLHRRSGRERGFRMWRTSRWKYWWYRVSLDTLWIRRCMANRWSDPLWHENIFQRVGKCPWRLLRTDTWLGRRPRSSARMLGLHVLVGTHRIVGSCPRFPRSSLANRHTRALVVSSGDECRACNTSFLIEISKTIREPCWTIS